MTQLSDLMLSLDILSKPGMLFSMLIGLTVASLRLPENARLILDMFFLVISARYIGIFFDSPPPSTVNCKPATVAGKNTDISMT